MNHQQLVEAVARSVNVRPSDIGPGVTRDIPYDEVVSYIRSAALAEGSFPRTPAEPQMSEQVFLLRRGSGWSVVWYVSPAGGAIPPVKYERHFAGFEEAFDEFLRGYLPKPPHRVRHGAAFIVP
jgi:hypothetical protein